MLTVRWVIFWSSTVPGKFMETTDTGDDGYNHRFCCAFTADFETVSDSWLLYDPGFNSIDATLFAEAGKFYLFFKDERKQPLMKNLRYATAAKVEGPYSEASQPFTGDWVEGPLGDKDQRGIPGLFRPLRYATLLWGSSFNGPEELGRLLEADALPSRASARERPENPRAARPAAHGGITAYRA